MYHIVRRTVRRVLLLTPDPAVNEIVEHALARVMHVHNAPPPAWNGEGGWQERIATPVAEAEATERGERIRE